MVKSDNLLSCDDVKLFDVLDECAFVVNPDTFEILYLNDKLCKTFNTEKKEDYCGLHCYEFLHHRSKPCHNCEAVLLNEKNPSITWRSYNALTKQHFNVTDKLFYYKGKLARVEILVDITRQIQQRDDLQAALAMEMTLSGAVRELYSQSDFLAGIRSMFSYLGEHLQAERVFLYEKQGYKFKVVHEWCNEGARPWKESTGSESFPARGKLWQECLSEFQPVIVNDTKSLREKYPEECRMFLEVSVYNFILMPIMLKGDIVGFFGLDNLLDNRAQNLPSLMKTLSYFISALMSADRNKQLLEMLSFTDSMTGVENRNAYIRAINMLSKEERPVGVICFDLNGLKKENDLHGHTAGDKKIIRLAQAIGKIFRKEEIFRTGGDEFMVLCAGIPEIRFQKRVESIKAYFEELGDLNVAVGSEWCRFGKAVKNAVSTADEIMYEAKRNYYLSEK